MPRTPKCLEAKKADASSLRRRLLDRSPAGLPQKVLILVLVSILFAFFSHSYVLHWRPKQNPLKTTKSVDTPCLQGEILEELLAGIYLQVVPSRTAWHPREGPGQPHSPSLLKTLVTAACSALLLLELSRCRPFLRLFQREPKSLEGYLKRGWLGQERMRRGRLGENKADKRCEVYAVQR